MRVAILRVDKPSYHSTPPFHPSVQYPEITRLGADVTAFDNLIYDAVRRALAILGLDLANLDTPLWNPLRQYVQPGDKVVIKPNFVLHEFGAFEGTNCLTTHGSVIRAMIDYIYLAGGPDCSIVIADAPIQGANFELITQKAGIDEIQEYYWRKFRKEIVIYDLRQVRAIIDEGSSFIKRIERLPGDPLGYQVVNMGRDSRLSELDDPRTSYVVGDYDASVTNTRHKNGRHEYVVSNTILSADTIISLPKLKTHNKVGITVCMKNLVGIVGSKDCLPHHRSGKQGSGGDEFPDGYPTSWYISNLARTRLQNQIPVPVWRFLRKAARFLFGVGTPPDAGVKSLQTAFFPSGSWFGNDTIWRTVDDLNRILFFYDEKAQEFSDTQQRRFFVMVDGVVAMEGNGPLRGVPKPCGVLIAGDDPLAIDVIAATIMGFEWNRIPMLRGVAGYTGPLKYSAFSGDESEISVVSVVSNEPRWKSLQAIRMAHLGFVPPAGWRQSVEVANA
jgi:uncharacterized protein (DUF362 family)